MRLLRSMAGMVGVVILAGCGGGGTMPPPDARAESAAMAQALIQRGPSMAEVLARPRQAQPALAAQAPGATVKRLESRASVPPHPDLIWFNAGTGQTVSWTMSGTQVAATNTLYQSTDMKFRAAADLNGDGQEDLLWEDARTGRLVAWLMNGASAGDVLETRTLLEDPAWRLVQTGDFNGDGRDDLLFANETTGEVVMWLMDGTTVLESKSWNWARNWRAVGAADINGDGKDDLIWESRTNRECAVWLMSGTEILVSGVPWTRPQGAQVSAAADIAGDGLVELLVDGTLPNGPQALQLRASAPPMPIAQVSAASDWPPKRDPQIMAVGDVAGTGANTIFWRQGPTGFTFASQLLPGSQGFAKREWMAQLLKVDPAWRVDRAVDLDGDHKADLVWRKASSGQVVVSLMNGLEARGEVELLADPAWAIVGVRQAIRRPIAKISVDPVVRAGVAMQLDGSASLPRSREPLSYQWKLIEKPAGSQAVLTNATAARPQITPDVEGSYHFSLVVTAGGWASKTVTTKGRVEPSVVTQAALEPESRLAGEANHFRLSVRLTSGLAQGDTLRLEFPTAYGDLSGPYWWVETSLFDYTVLPRALEFRLRATQPALPPGSQISFGDMVVRYGVPHPAGAGTYVFKVSTTKDVGPVDIPVRVTAANTQVRQPQITRSDDALFHRGDYVFEFWPAVPLQAGSRVFVDLPDSYDVSGARLATPSDGLNLQTQLIRRLAITVWDPALLSSWAQQGKVRLAVAGIGNPACNNDAWTFDFRTSEDTLPKSVPAATTVPSGPGVTDARITGRLDNQGQWFWSVAFTAPGGLPAGADVLLKFPQGLMQHRDSDGSWYGPMAQPLQHPDCPAYRKLPVTAAIAVAPGARFNWSGSSYMEALRPPPPGNYEVELYTSVDSKPVIVPVIVPAR